MVFQPEDVDGILASNCEPLTLRVGPLTRKLIKCKNVHENRDDAEETREICETRRTDDALRGARVWMLAPHSQARLKARLVLTIFPSAIAGTMVTRLSRVYLYTLEY